jgi:hypothetical protein
LTQENLSVSCYFTNLKGLWDEINNYRPLPSCSCGTMKKLVDFRDEERIFQFLMGLNETFSHIRGQIILIDPLPPINKVFSLIIQEERQRQIISSVGSLNHNTAAMMTTASQNQSQGSKISNQGYKSTSTRKERPKCTHCGILGHTIDKCYKIHGFPPGFKFTRGKSTSSANQVSDYDVPQLPITNEQYEQLVSMLKQQPPTEVSGSVNNVITQDHLFDMAGNHSFSSTYFSLDIKHSVFCSSTSFDVASKISPKNPWIIDTGATDHMVCSLSCLTSITSIVSKFVRLPNGKYASVTHIGTVKISENLILTDVFCVPSFSFNLISASKLIKVMHCCLIFLAGFCFIQHLSSWRTIGMGREQGGLFFLMHNMQSSASFSNKDAQAFSVVSDSLWHFRLGHLSDDRLKLLFPDCTLVSNKCCSICPLAKQHRLPFHVSTSVSRQFFDLLHCDIWGPFSVQSTNNSSYFLTLVDDY